MGASGSRTLTWAERDGRSPSFDFLNRKPLILWLNEPHILPPSY
jgi:hypothetical protein